MGWAEAVLSDLARVSIETVAVEPEQGHTRLLAGKLHGFIPLEGVIDIDAEIARLDKAIGEAESDLKRVEGKLANPQFLEKAPDAVVAKERAKQTELGDLVETLKAQRAAL